MIQDLHAHTYYSFCSQDKPETVIETAIANGIQQLGICDHNYGVGCARIEFCWDKGTRLDADFPVIEDYNRFARGDEIARLYSSTVSDFTNAKEMFESALTFSQDKPYTTPVVIKTICS